jgi:hypothetical protein
MIDDDADAEDTFEDGDEYVFDDGKQARVAYMRESGAFGDENFLLKARMLEALADDKIAEQGLDWSDKTVVMVFPDHVAIKAKIDGEPVTIRLEHGDVVAFDPDSFGGSSSMN